jgi:uncharacterized protein YkwD
MPKFMDALIVLGLGCVAFSLVACAGTGVGRDVAPAAFPGTVADAEDHSVAVGADAGQRVFTDNRLEIRAFLLANRARKSAGLPPLEMRYDLVGLARIHAEDMARRDFFSHYNPDGIGPGTRARRESVDYLVFAENLARVRNSNDPALLAVDGWLKSPGHRRNLLDEGAAAYRYTGVGVVRRADGTVLLSQVFLR